MIRKKKRRKEKKQKTRYLISLGDAFSRQPPLVTALLQNEEIRCYRTLRVSYLTIFFHSSTLIGSGFDGTPSAGISTPAVQAIALRMRVRQSSLFQVK